MTTSEINSLRDRLLWLSHEIGKSERDFAMLGEGNASVNCNDGSFLIKASGGNLETLDESGLTRVDCEPILRAIEDSSIDDMEVQKILMEARVDKDSKRPSVETFLHAVCLQEEEIQWIGHCHPISVLQVLCSTQGAEPFLKHIFPDEIVVCGRHLAVVPYIDPGIELARTVKQTLKDFRKNYGGTPKLILMENHGPVAMGASEKEVLNILMMLDKWSKIIVGNFALGGPSYLSETTSHRIDTRPDELYRRSRIDSQ